MDPSGNAGEFVGRLYDLGEILAIIEAMAKTGYSAAKQATPAGVATSIIFKPSKAGETEKDLKNDVEFQKFLSGGGTGDPNKGNKKNNGRKFNIKKQESEVWKKLDSVKGMDRKTSGSGKSKKFYEWDYTHNDIEVYNYKGQHIGSMNPLTGKMYKSPVKGRVIKIK